MSGVCRREWECSNLGPVEGGYLIGSDTKGGHSLFVCTLGRRSSFVARSVVLVNIGESARSRTNLVVEDGILQTLEKPGRTFVVLSVVGKT